MAERFPPVTDEAIQFMETNTVGAIESSKLLDAASMVELTLSGISYAELMSSFQLTSGNRIKTTDGDEVKIETKDKYFHFPVKKKLYDDNEAADNVLPSFQTMSERGDAKRRTFATYVNGGKVPDSRVLVYASKVGTDILIPQYYFSNAEPNEITCVVRDWSSGMYNVWYNQNQSGMSVSGIPVSIDVRHFTSKNVIVWASGELVDKSKYTTSTDGQTLSVTFTEPPSNAEIYTLEVAIDMFVSGRFEDKRISSTNDLYFYVPKDDPVFEGTILSQYMCDFYLNRRRVSATKIKQISERHFQYLPSTPDNITHLEIFVNDRSHEEAGFETFMDAFMQYEKWVDDTEIAERLSGVDTGNRIQPEFVNKETLQFPVANKYLTDSDLTRFLTNEEKARLMIEENSSYFRHLLKFWAIPEENYTAERNPAIPLKDKEEVHIILDHDDEDKDNMTTRLLELYVNEKKIENRDVTQFNRWRTDNLSIPIRNFSQGPGVDKIRLYKYPVKNNNVGFRKFSVAGQPWYGSDTWKFVDSIDEVDGILGDFDVNELRIFRAVTRDADKGDSLFIDIVGASLYFRIIPVSQENYELAMMPDPSKGGSLNLAIKIPDTSIIDDDDLIVISKPRMHFSRSYKVNNYGDKFATSRILLNPIVEGMAMPITLDKYLVKVYCNGRLMVPGLDYVLVSPDSNERLTVTPITFRKIINVSDVIEVEYTGIKNRVYAYYDVVPSSDKYGFIFFDKLEIPFSLDYLDLYINGIKLTQEDVEIYTDRLIKVKSNILLPYRDVILISRLRLDMNLFDPYIQAHLANRNAFDLYIRRFCRDILFDPIPEDDRPPLNEDPLGDIFE